MAVRIKLPMVLFQPSLSLMTLRSKVNDSLDDLVKLGVEPTDYEDPHEVTIGYEMSRVVREGGAGGRRAARRHGEPLEQHVPC